MAPSSRAAVTVVMVIRRVVEGMKCVRTPSSKESGDRKLRERRITASYATHKREACDLCEISKFNFL